VTYGSFEFRSDLRASMMAAWHRFEDVFVAGETTSQAA
jgi:hypothetical protein